ncbi:MAG TPA: energy-coupling factor transporter ATPase [Clostridiales bacterium]|nr:energy-coupling factor transporter ATPase [Clostridiales bacterium]
MSIKTKNLTHIYMQGSPFEQTAIEDINLEIHDGEFVGLIGHTGSGKSTLIQHFNGLLSPTSGTVFVDGVDIFDKLADIKEIRQRVGMVFQYPEHQLFEETVFEDIAFGPKNLGLQEAEVRSRVREALEIVGLPYDEIKDKSPFELSGGQRRRVAIAGVLAMRPQTLILDEPTAGLDPKGKNEILSQIKTLHEKYNTTIILVSHSMEDIAKLADRIIVMDHGSIALSGTPREVFTQARLLEDIGLDVPQITKLMLRLKERKLPVTNKIFTVDQAVAELKKVLGGNSHD